MSRRGLFGSLLAVSVGAITGCRSEQVGPTGTDPVALYEFHCARCHARAGEPGGPTVGGSKGPDLAHIGSATGMTVDWLTEYISNPQSKRPKVRIMPAFGEQLSQEQIRSLAEWLAAKK